MQSKDFDFLDGLQQFKSRLHLTQNEIADLAEGQRAGIAWVCTGRRPIKYMELANLLKNGMLLEEAFGKKIADIIKNREFSQNIDLQNIPDDICRQIVARGLSFAMKQEPHKD